MSSDSLFSQLDNLPKYTNVIWTVNPSGIPQLSFLMVVKLSEAMIPLPKFIWHYIHILCVHTFFSF
jgi:hypothetical protein